MYPGQIILLSARVREGHILKAKFRLGGKAGAQGGSCPPAGAAHGYGQEYSVVFFESQCIYLHGVAFNIHICHFCMPMQLFLRYCYMRSVFILFTDMLIA